MQENCARILAQGIQMTGTGTGLRVAFMGKGGAGKSALTGTVCRHLARQGRSVLALDLDTVPGLAWSLGTTANDKGLLPPGLAQLVQDDNGRRWETVPGRGPARLVDRYAADGPDGICFLMLGKLPDGVEPSVTVAFRYIMEGYRRSGWNLIADLAAGTRQPMFGWTRFARLRIVVAEPTAKSILTARRLQPVATHLVLNKVPNREAAADAVARVGLPLLAAIPYDREVAEAERHGIAPVDFAQNSPAVQAMADLTKRLEAMA